jgi:hypothetical protein
VLLKTLIMNGRCKSKSTANSKNQLFASIFDFADGQALASIKQIFREI